MTTGSLLQLQSACADQLLTLLPIAAVAAMLTFILF
jgi:hypothetical protein